MKTGTRKDKTLGKKQTLDTQLRLTGKDHLTHQTIKEQTKEFKNKKKRYEKALADVLKLRKVDIEYTLKCDYAKW